MYGLDTEVINDLKEIFSKFKQIDSVILYGSRAKGNYRKGSDIDLTLLGEGLTLNVVYKIQNKIEDLNLPYEFDISIHKQIDNEKLKDHISRVGKIFYRKKIVLPKGWEVKKLNEVCEILNGGTPDTAVPKFWDGENLWITPKDMGKLDSIYVDDTLRKITDEGLKNSSAKILPPNSIILSSRAPIGHLAINTKPISTNQGCKGLVPKKNLSTLYLCYFLSKSIELLNSLGTGATFKELSGSKLGTVEIQIPPLPEQKHIVTILDKAFAAIAKAKANAEQNLKNAKELFESYLQGVLENKSEGWEFTKLKHNIDLLTGFAFKSKYYTDNEEDILLLRGDNIMQGEFRWKDAKKWKKSEYYEFEKYQLQENDIVLAMDRPWVNAGLKCAKVSKTDIPSLLVQRTACLRNNSKINNSFLYYLIKSKGFMDYLLDVQTGIGVPHISGKQISNFTFKKPPINKQKFIVKKLDTLSAETNKLEAIYQQKIEDLEELKKSLLQKAFNGELTEKEIII